MHGLAGWVLLTFGNDRGWAGNSGYNDDPTRLYRYDSFVQNHKQLKAGDVALVRSKTELLGVAQIAKIKQAPGTKERLRCPLCNTGNFSKRSTTRDNRCFKGHVFINPKVSYEDCVKYEADFDHSFVPTPGALSIEDLRGACPRYNRQLAMQRVDLSLLAGKLFRVNPAAEFLLRGGYIGGDVGYEAEDESVDQEYWPTDSDTRREVFRAIRARRGQRKFRDRLRQRYGDSCMISGCALMDVVEAAHISPFRGDDDNHPQNGLLLRADLHTLFDLDVLGIEPNGLRVHIRPEAMSAGYSKFQGARLQCHSDQRPSRHALEMRWSLFSARMGISV